MIGDNYKIPFGKHRGSLMKDLPDEWINDFWEKGKEWYKGKQGKSKSLKGYHRDKFNVLAYIENKYENDSRSKGRNSKVDQG